MLQCDDEGNVRGEEYESNPWSGLGYRIVHESDDCPIYTCEDGYNLIYDSREAAIKAWNTRAERTCHNMSDFQDCDCFICSECGEAFETARLEYDDDLFYSLNDAVHEDYYDRCDCDLNYCPHCGAKVIQDANE